MEIKKKKKSKRKKKEKGKKKRKRKKKEIRKVKKKRKKEKEAETDREGHQAKEKRGKERNLTLSPRSTNIGPSVFVEARDKVHLRDESYTWAPKSRNFDTVQIRVFGKSKVLGLGSVHETS